MSDASKQKSGPRSTTRASNFSQNATFTQNSRSFSPQADLEVQILAAPSPIFLAKDARSWLENKGWILNSEENSNAKLSDILFTTSLAFKLPTNACAAIHSVAFLLRAHADETLSTTVSDLIIDKMIDKFSEPLSRLNNSITATKMFLDAAAQKQASGLLSLQDSVKQQETLAKSLADSADKLIRAPSPLGLDETAWPRLSANPSGTLLAVPPGGQMIRGNHQTNPKVAQRVALTAKQLLIEYGPLDVGEELHPRTIKAQREFRQVFNGWLDVHNTDRVRHR